MLFGGPLSMMLSPCLAAGNPLMRTLELPGTAVPPTCGTTPVTSGQGWKSTVARQAGWPPIITFGLPGPDSGVPCAVWSSTRAAGGIVYL
jgi:hypothetical protein